MKVFTCDDHDGVWLGGASVVVAEDETAARDALVAELKDRLLRTDGFTLKELNTSTPSVTVLWNGDY